MFTDWIRRRAIQKEIDTTYKDYAPALKSAKATEAEEILAERDSLLSPLMRRLAVLESVQLVDKAHKLGIEIPSTESWWEFEYAEDGIGSYRSYLSELGKVKVAKLIREEKLKNAEQWIKLIAPLISALTGLLGVIIGLIAILSK